MRSFLKINFYYKVRLQLHHDICTYNAAALKISLVCIMLWFPMKGLWLTGRREAEERNGEYPSISWTLGKLNERSLLSKKCK